MLGIGDMLGRICPFISEFDVPKKFYDVFFLPRLVESAAGMSPSHPTCPHTTCPHTTYSHTTYSHTQLVHTQLDHTQLVHTQLTHTQLTHTHTQLVHTQLTHTHTTYSHTQLTHTHTTYSHTHTTCPRTHTQLFHTHTTLSHTTCSHTHNLLTHTQLARTQLTHTHTHTASFAWQAWHLVTSTFTLCGRRGTYGTELPLVARLGVAGTAGLCVAGVAPMALHWLWGCAWVWRAPRDFA